MTLTTTTYLDAAQALGITLTHPAEVKKAIRYSEALHDLATSKPPTVDLHPGNVRQWDDLLDRAAVAEARRAVITRHVQSGTLTAAQRNVHKTTRQHADHYLTQLAPHVTGDDLGAALTFANAVAGNTRDTIAILAAITTVPDGIEMQTVRADNDAARDATPDQLAARTLANTAKGQGPRAALALIATGELDGYTWSPVDNTDEHARRLDDLTRAVNVHRTGVTGVHARPTNEAPRIPLRYG